MKKKQQNILLSFMGCGSPALSDARSDWSRSRSRDCRVSIGTISDHEIALHEGASYLRTSAYGAAINPAMSAMNPANSASDSSVAGFTGTASVRATSSFIVALGSRNSSQI
jgi:hypothetical protein